LTVSSDSCDGFARAQWTASSGATGYELWGSTSTSFSSPFLTYSGPNTFQDLNVAVTTYFHVRACNANGCGPFSNTGKALYFTTGCP
jgi:hypothetical protein